MNEWRTLSTIWLNGSEYILFSPANRALLGYTGVLQYRLTLEGHMELRAPKPSECLPRNEKTKQAYSTKRITERNKRHIRYEHVKRGKKQAIPSIDDGVIDLDADVVRI